MDGDEAPLAGIVDLAEKHGAMVMVDEAHATGLYGATGAGVVAKLGLGDRVLVQMGTLGKALGGFGAYVAGSRALRDLLINRCRSFIFTTSLPPAVVAMAIAAIDLVKREPERRGFFRRGQRRIADGKRVAAAHRRKAGGFAAAAGERHLYEVCHLYGSRHRDDRAAQSQS